MNRIQNAEASRPEIPERRLHSVGGPTRGTLLRVRPAADPVLVGGLRAVSWPVGVLSASSVLLIAAQPWRPASDRPDPGAPAEWSGEAGGRHPPAVGGRFEGLIIAGRAATGIAP